MKTLLRTLRANATTLIAVLLTAIVVGPTSAYAVATIRSADIVDGEVKAVDLGANAVRSPKILDGEVKAEDLGANAVRGTKVLDRSIGNQDLAADAVTADKVADGSLGGLDVNESTLATVPSALQAGLGRSDPTGSCDPETSAFMACATVQITLNQPGRLFVIGTVNAQPELSDDNFVGNCQINTTQGPIESSRDTVDGTDGNDYYDSLTLHTITSVFPAGTAYVWIECNQGFRGSVVITSAHISVVGLSAG